MSVTKGRWYEGQVVFAVDRWSNPERGRFIKLDRATPSRAYCGLMAWDLHGRPYGEPLSSRSAWPTIREVRDGDDVLDKAWHEAWRAEREAAKHKARAWTLTSVHGETWVKLTADQLDVVFAMLAGVKK